MRKMAEKQQEVAQWGIVYGRSIETSISSIGMTGIIKALLKSVKTV